MIAAIYAKEGRTAELERFEYCSYGEEGDSQCDEYWSVTIIPENDPENFKEYTFMSDYLAALFLIENGYREVVE